MRSSRRLAGIGTAALVVLAGCSTDPDPSPTVTTPTTASPTASGASPSPSSPSPTPSPSTSAGTSVPAGFDLEDKKGGTFPDLGDDVGPGAGVRVGKHTGYDRVVFDFADTGTPTYLVRYVDTPVSDGSGDPVAVKGDAYLEVLVTNVSVPSGSTKAPADSGPAELSGTVVAEANAIFGGFEGHGQSFIGVLGQKRPFRVSLESTPTRLVIDIAR
ncbi:MAG: hypothetical protein ABIU87_03615 [Ornithinibacter sp.]